MVTIEIRYDTEHETYSVHPPNGDFYKSLNLDYPAALDEAEAMREFYAEQGVSTRIKER